MKPLTAVALAALLVLPGCLFGPAPVNTPGAAGNASGPAEDAGPPAAGLLWVPGVSYRFNVTDAAGEFKGLRQYTVKGLNTTMGSPCWEVVREDAVPTGDGTGWRLVAESTIFYNATNGGLCAMQFPHNGEVMRTRYVPQVLAFWPPGDRDGSGEVLWVLSNGREGTEVDLWDVRHEGTVNLTIDGGTFEGTEVFVTKFLATGELRQRTEQRLWYSPQVGFFVKREHLGTGQAEEYVVNRDPVPGFSGNS